MDEILQVWLSQQCQTLPGARCATLQIGPLDKGPYDTSLLWPNEKTDTSSLNRVIQAVLRSKQSVVKTRNSTIEETDEPLDAIACPVFFQGQMMGVLAIEMTNRSQVMQQTAMQHVQTGLNWLETMIVINSSSTKKQMMTLVELLVAGTEHENFKVSLTQVATELSERFSCRQVSIGFLKHNRLHVEALSNCKELNRNSSLINAIRDAMTEALDQGSSVVYPQGEKKEIALSHFHQKLEKLQQGICICTVPLVKTSKAVGALLLERDVDKTFSKEAVEQCEQIGLLLGPVLETRRRDERFIIFKVIDSLRTWLGRLFGPHYLPLKTASALTVALLLWLSMASGQFIISTDSLLEASVSRAIVAPQEGYIKAAHARAGDRVNKGDVLAALDDKDLRLEQRKWLTQQEQLLKEYRQALATQNRAEVAIINAKRLQAEAQLRLVEQQLARTSLVAPFPGLIVKGDLSQSLGTPVERGEVLYEVAPTDEYKVVLKVDDRDIGLISTGQHGKLRLSSIPDQLIDVQVDRVTPVSSVESGRNYFRVEATLMNHSDLLRPGMEGVTRIEIGQAKKIWIWTRRLVDSIRQLSWRWLP